MLPLDFSRGDYLAWDDNLHNQDLRTYTMDRGNHRQRIAPTKHKIWIFCVSPDNTRLAYLFDEWIQNKTLSIEVDKNI